MAIDYSHIALGSILCAPTDSVPLVLTVGLAECRMPAAVPCSSHSTASIVRSVRKADQLGGLLSGECSGQWVRRAAVWCIKIIFWSPFCCWVGPSALGRPGWRRVPRPGDGFLVLVGWVLWPGQVGCGSALRRARPVVMRCPNGACADRWSQVRRDRRAIRPAMENSRRRSRLGSQTRASVPVRASICIHAVSSVASMTTATQIWFCEKSCRGRFFSPVSFALRMRSSQRARRRCRSSRSGELPTFGVGGERGEPVAVGVGEPQLGAGVWSFGADDDPHPGRPPGQVQQPGQFGDPGTVARCLVGVVGGGPRRLRDQVQLGDRVHAQAEPDGVLQALPGQPGHEVVGAAGAVGADQHRPPGAASRGGGRQLRQRGLGDLDVIDGGV